ncbi:MAG: 6,7-dimethyl-8-ribityllumazine synthase [Bradymonadaceae bacterium]|nr:6,7-dimethyl-8-ribityllumazine synthase [Lujinxingiaceae bacterium]
MARIIEGNFSAEGKRFGIVASRWNSIFSEQLVAGAIDTLVRHGAEDRDIIVVRVPGSYELAQASARLLKSVELDAVLCLGVLIRGSTPHFDFIASEAAKGIAGVGMETGVPVAFGVITCDTIEQAIERSGSKAGNKGAEAAMAAIEMANLFSEIEQL